MSEPGKLLPTLFTAKMMKEVMPDAMSKVRTVGALRVQALVPSLSRRHATAFGGAELQLRRSPWSSHR